jgi:hypothetical protein
MPFNKFEKAGWGLPACFFVPSRKKSRATSRPRENGRMHWKNQVLQFRTILLRVYIGHTLSKARILFLPQRGQSWHRMIGKQ